MKRQNYRADFDSPKSVNAFTDWLESKNIKHSLLFLVPRTISPVIAFAPYRYFTNYQVYFHDPMTIEEYNQLIADYWKSTVHS
jgi:hypothetical protein